MERFRFIGYLLSPNFC